MDLIRRNFGLKVTAFAIAIALWFTFNYLTTTQDVYTKTLEVPVVIRGVASGLVAATTVDKTSVELGGSRSDLAAVTPADLVAYVDCGGRGAGAYDLTVAVAGPSADTIKAVEPSEAIVTVDRYAYRIVPVVARDETGAQLNNAVLAPRTIEVAGAQSAVAHVVAAEIEVPEPHALPVGFAAEMKPTPIDDRLAPVSGASAIGVVSITNPGPSQR